MFDVKLDKIPWDKVLWIGGGAVAIYFAYQWYQTQQDNSAAVANAQAQSDAQLAQIMLEQPLSNGTQSDSSAAVTAPSVDTGNTELQSLISSILNPTATTTSTPSTTTTSTPPTTSAPSTTTTSTPPTTSTSTTPTNADVSAIVQAIVNQNPGGSIANGILVAQHDII
jgi:hypothetical protein